ncbi:MAG: hypothetical protein ACE5HO_12705 [bacterium]
MGNNIEKLNRWEAMRLAVKRVLKPQFIQEWTGLWKEFGFLGLVKRKGWRIVTVIVIFYLIRDSILYLLLPYLAYLGLFAD